MRHLKVAGPPEYIVDILNRMQQRMEHPYVEDDPRWGRGTNRGRTGNARARRPLRATVTKITKCKTPGEYLFDYN